MRVEPTQATAGTLDNSSHQTISTGSLRHATRPPPRRRKPVRRRHAAAVAAIARAWAQRGVKELPAREEGLHFA